MTHCEKVLRGASPRASMDGLWREYRATIRFQANL